MKLLMAAAVAAAMLTAAPAKAAQIWVGSADGHGHVIHIEGEIVKGDANRFATAVGQAKVAPGDATVYLAGPGGNVWDGILIARAIKRYGWNTYVEAPCASMCANIWLAGHTRFINSEAKIGFHSLSDKRRPGQRAEQANSSFMAFYREMGVSAKAARVFLAAEPGADAIWLTADLASSLGIEATTVTPKEAADHTQPKGKQKASAEEVDAFCRWAMTINTDIKLEIDQKIAAAKTAEEREAAWKRGFDSCVGTINSDDYDIAAVEAGMRKEAEANANAKKSVDAIKKAMNPPIKAESDPLDDTPRAQPKPERRRVEHGRRVRIAHAGRVCAFRVPFIGIGVRVRCG
jgi:hypothetical protein